MRPFKRASNVVLATLMLLSLVNVPLLTSVALADVSNCIVTATLVNPCRPWLGAVTGNYPQAASTVAAQVAYHEQRIGRQLDIIHTYHSVGSNTLSSTDVAYATRANTILYTNWKPAADWPDGSGSNASVNAGIDQMAASVKALGNHKIMMTLWHEPENDVTSDPNCPNVTFKGSAGTPTDYRAMWQNVESRFKADGVTNVVWAVDYMNYPTWDCLVPDVYPGDSMVDWIMFNGYATTNNFVTNVQRFQNLLTADTDATHSFTSKPWGIVEWGIHGFTEPQQVAYYDQAKAALDAGTLPLIKAYMIFDENDQGSATGQNLRVGYDDDGTLDPTKQAHYTAFADDPLINGAFTLPQVDVTSPVVTLATPSAGSTLSGLTTVSATDTDDVGVTSARLVVDGAVYGAAQNSPASPMTFQLDTSTLSSGSHTLQVTANDAAGNVGSSALIRVTVDNSDHTPPSVPTGLASGTVTNNSTTLTWQPATDNVAVTGYNVVRGGTMIAQVPASQTSYFDTNLTPVTGYSYQVQAVDAAGNTSALSDPYTISTLAAADITPPSVPTVPTIGSVTGSTVSVSWPASSDDTTVAGYHVYRNGTRVGTVTNGTSFQDTGLTDATAYQYQVDAYDPSGNTSAESVAVTAVTPDVTPPSVPSNLAISTPSYQEADLSWQGAHDNVGVTNYNIYRNGNLVGSSSSTTFNDTGLSPQTNYQYTLTAADAAGNVSAPTTVTSVTTPALPDSTPPSVPAGVTAVAATPVQVNVSWQASTDNVGVAGYHVYRNGLLVATITTGTTYPDVGVVDASSYTYTVDAFDAAGNSSLASSPVAVTTPDGTPPTVPTGLNATATAYNQVTLAWSASADNVGVASYTISRGGQIIATVAAGTTVYSDQSVTPSTTFSYTVSAVDAAGNTSAPSSTATVTTPAMPDTTPPTVPLNVAAKATSGTQVNVTWSAAADNVGVTGYQIFRNGNAVGTTTGLSFADTGLHDVTTYRYTVDAYDAAGNTSSVSSSVSATTPDATAPTPPGQLKVTAASYNQVGLSWTAAADNVGVVGYVIYRAGVAIGTVGNVTTYIDTTVAPQTNYSYTVAAVDAAGNTSSLSSPASVTTPAIPDTTPPSVPAGVTAVAATPVQVNVAWQTATDNVGVAGYHVYRNGTKIATVTAGTSYVDVGVTGSMSYSYSVDAYDAAGNTSTQSKAVMAVTPDGTAPTAPKNLTATAANATQVNLVWTASTDNVGVFVYRIYRGGVQLGAVGGTVLTYADKTVAAKTSYSYTVVAYDAAGNVSQSSNTASVTTPAAPDTTPPTVPTGLKTTATSASSVTLAWTASSDNVGVALYSIYRGTTLIGTSTSTSYTDTTFAQGQTYSYTVSASDAAGNMSAKSSPLSVTIPDTTPPTVPTNLKAVAGVKSNTLSWTASTDNVGVQGYYILRNGVRIATITSGTTYTDTGLTSGTKYTYTIRSYDASGNLSALTAGIVSTPK